MRRRSVKGRATTVERSSCVSQLLRSKIQPAHILSNSDVEESGRQNAYKIALSVSAIMRPPMIFVRRAGGQVHDFWKGQRGNSGTASRDVNQIRTFYELGDADLFITFANGLLHWCRPTGPVEILSGRGRQRDTVDGWHSCSHQGTSHSSDRISESLLNVQMFRGTICRVEPFAYLI